MIEPPWDRLQPFIDQVRSGRRKREKALLDLLEAILHITHEQVAAVSTSYFQRYEKTEAKIAEIPAKLAMGASFLVHLGEHLKREVPVPANVEDHVVRL